eukprot:jgi/Mesen1/9174/ME000591S08500
MAAKAVVKALCFAFSRSSPPNAAPARRHVSSGQAIELATFEGIKRFISAVERRQKEEYGDDCLRVRVLGRTVKLPPVNPSGVAGAAAGVMCTLACYPLEVLKVHSPHSPHSPHLPHPPHLGTIVREEGAGVLYRGLTPTLVGMVPYSAAYFYLYDSFKTRYRLAGRQHLDTPETLVIGGLAGVAASWSTYPLEVARKRIMVGSLGGTRKVYKNMIDALVSIAREEGLQGLYRGLGPSTLKVMPASGLSWALYEACKSILKVDTGL